MNDRELLELAAKAAGIDPRLIDGIDYDTPSGMRRGGTHYWRPLTDDGDALRLAVKLDLLGADFDYDRVVAQCKDDPYAATRRAIVRAAAEIGKVTK